MPEQGRAAVAVGPLGLQRPVVLVTWLRLGVEVAPVLVPLVLETRCFACATGMGRSVYQVLRWLKTMMPAMIACALMSNLCAPIQACLPFGRASTTSLCRPTVHPRSEVGRPWLHAIAQS